MTLNSNKLLYISVYPAKSGIYKKNKLCAVIKLSPQRLRHETQYFLILWTVSTGFLLDQPNHAIHIPLLHQIQSYALLPNQHHNRPALHNDRIVIVILRQRPILVNMVWKQNKSANAKGVVSGYMQKCLLYQRHVCFMTQNLIPPISHNRKEEGCPRCFWSAILHYFPANFIRLSRTKRNPTSTICGIHKKWVSCLNLTLATFIMAKSGFCLSIPLHQLPPISKLNLLKHQLLVAFVEQSKLLD